jgi:hypothetical protein
MAAKPLGEIVLSTTWQKKEEEVRVATVLPGSVGALLRDLSDAAGVYCALRVGGGCLLLVDGGRVPSRPQRVAASRLA